MSKKGQKTSRERIMRVTNGLISPKKRDSSRFRKSKAKKNRLVSRRFSIIWFGVVFGFDPKNGTPNKSKHHGALYVPTFCI